MFFILQAQPAPGPFGGMSSLIFMGMIMLVFWLFFIRPQAKKQKQQKLFIEDLKKGDKVVTIAGIHGRINRVNDDGTIDLEINPGSYIKMEKSAISLEMTQQLNKATGVTTTATTDKK
ncbi:MAG TPA: preprotein translocase subunit YajC [Flavisolibacter sp.]|jgi:preprotein translocase subunit YajC|nr:preprotein translocase subunit YajC [Flavisolibacter sp.]